MRLHRTRPLSAIPNQALLVFAESGSHKLELRLEDSGKCVHTRAYCAVSALPTPSVHTVPAPSVHTVPAPSVHAGR